MYARYADGMQSGRHPRALLEEMSVQRMCCRRMFLGHVDLVAEQMAYPNRDIRLDEGGTVLKREVHGERVVACD